MDEGSEAAASSCFQRSRSSATRKKARMALDRREWLKNSMGGEGSRAFLFGKWSDDCLQGCDLFSSGHKSMAACYMRRVRDREKGRRGGQSKERRWRRGGDIRVSEERERGSALGSARY